MTTVQTTDIVRQVTPGKLLRALRAFSLPASVLPVLLATAAVAPVGRWRWDVLLAALAGAGLLHLAGNLLNDYFDYRYKVDRRTHDDDNRPGRLLVRRQLLPNDVLVEALACLAAALALGGYLTWQCGWGIVWFGLAGGAGLYAYTGPPLKLKYRALGELNIFLVFGPLLMAGSAWAQTGRWEPMALLLSIPVGLATTAILVGNNFRDRQEDGQAGIRTIGHFANGNVARLVYVALVTGAALGLAGIGLFTGRWLLLACPLTLLLLGKALGCILRNQRLPDIDAHTARFEAVLLVVATAAFLVGG
jgi:1,4-dihydroxy-2-naphthoate octaprenyltransferase